VADSEAKRLREKKIKWLSIAFELVGLPPVPPESSGVDLFGVKTEKIRRDTVPFHPKVMTILQGFVNQHFDIISKNKQNKAVKDILKFCEASKQQNECFRNPAAVPGVLIDYIEDEIKDKLGKSSASHAARLQPGTTLANEEKEALILEDRAKLDIQLNNSVCIDLLALKKLAQDQVSLLSNFLSDPPKDPTTFEDFTVRRQTVSNLMLDLSDNAASLKMGVEDSLFVARDHLKLHAQDLIKGHVDRRAAWLSFSQGKALSRKLALSISRFLSLRITLKTTRLPVCWVKRVTIVLKRCSTPGLSLKITVLSR